jgi:hypothetical protein
MYLVTYDLKKPGQDYKDLHEAIKGCGTWWHYLESTWLLKTSLTATQIFERLQPYLDSNDRILIIRVTPNDKSGWLTQDAWNWINA